MSAIEQRARKLLAEAFACDVSELSAAEVRAVRAVLALSAALTPPEGDMGNPISVPDGFVLVPVEPTEAMKVAGSMWNTEMDEPPEFSALMSIWKDMLAARPEVKP